MRSTNLEKILDFKKQHIQNNFAHNLKALRIEAGLGQVELAKKLSVSKGIISLWENSLREPTLTYLIAIANFFNVTLDELVDE